MFLTGEEEMPGAMPPAAFVNAAMVPNSRKRSLRVVPGTPYMTAFLAQKSTQVRLALEPLIPLGPYYYYCVTIILLYVLVVPYCPWDLLVLFVSCIFHCHHHHHYFLYSYYISYYWAYLSEQQI
jgi:hypothetical protein